MIRRIAYIVALLLTFAVASAAGATLQSDVLAAARFEQHIGTRLPLKTAFIDSTGKQLTLADAIAGKPTILVLAWYGCPNLCALLLDNLTASLAKINRQAGKDYHLVVVGIDPKEGREDAAAIRNRLLRRPAAPANGQGWYFLSGAEQQIASVARASGFEYAYDADSAQYSHPTGLVMVTPNGVISRYLMGIDFTPRDLRLALSETSGGKLGSPVDNLLLRCFGFDPTTGKYSLRIMVVTRIVCSAFVVLLLFFLLVWLRRKQREVV